MAYFGRYALPGDILKATELSVDEKIEMLESWRDDKEAYMRASAEGMVGDDRSDLLLQIEKALAALS